MKTRFLSVLALGAIIFASCSNDDTTPEVNDGRVQFSSGISNIATPLMGKAAVDEWDAGDVIGIFMRDNAVGKDILSDNVKYTAEANGSSVKFITTSPIFYPVNTPAKVDFVAYHPYAALANNYEYSVDLSDQTSQSNIDLMTASADNNTSGYDKTNTTPINLQFSHQLSKVVINVKTGAGVSNLTGLAANIKGMNTTATFNIAANVLTDEDTPADITPAGTGSKLEAILLPIAFTNSHKVEFKLGGKTYTWIMNDNIDSLGNPIIQLEAGKKYTFDITISENEVKVSGTVKAWVNVDDIKGDAK